MRFEGWPERMVAFYRDLEDRTDALDTGQVDVEAVKAWWRANKAVYDRDVRAPLDALAAELAPEFGDPKVFRPYRDVRFSADKAPYKLQAAVLFRDAGVGACYCAVSASGITAGLGVRELGRDQLQRYREAVAGDAGDELAVTIDRLEETGFEVHGEALKTAPRGWSADHPRIGLLRRKELLIVRTEPPGPLVHTAAAREWVAATFRAGRPVLAWLEAHVGPSQDAAARR